MDDRSDFERRLTAGLEDIAGPGRRIDTMAMVQVASTRSSRSAAVSRFSVARLAVVGAIVVFGAFILVRLPAVPRQDTRPAAASESPAPTVTVQPIPGVVSEEIEPGVLRIIRDDAGHDLDERHPDFRYDLDSIAIGPDGTVWLRSTHHESDNGALDPQDPFVWALGRPGVFDARHGIPAGGGTSLVPLTDGSTLVVGDRIVRFDGTVVAPDDGRQVRPVHGGTLWLTEPDATMPLVPEGPSAGRPDDRVAKIWDGGSWIDAAARGRSASSNGFSCDATSSGVTCIDERTRRPARYLRGTTINEVARAPDGAIWAVGGYEGEGGGLYRISLE
jgi:hypothetical protein